MLITTDGRLSTLSRHTGLPEAVIQNRRSGLSAHRRVSRHQIIKEGQ